MEIYLFKVALESRKNIYRTIEMYGSHTLEDLHEMIYRAFDRDDEHLYSFFLTRKAVRGLDSRSRYPEYVAPDLDIGEPLFMQEGKYDASEAQISDLQLKVKDKFYYLFDYGDCWWHEITVLTIVEVPTKAGNPKIVQRSGPSPSQYDYGDQGM